MRIFETLLIGLIVACRGRAKLEFKDNSYEGLIVSISPDLENKDTTSLVDRIKSWIRSGSKTLFKSSRNWASIHNVTILIPADWSHPDAVTVDGLVYEDGHIRVSGISAQHGIGAFTERVKSECGAPGEYIQVSREFLSGDVKDVENIYGPLGQVFVHEWAKYRYGVWEEHGYSGDTNYPNLYNRIVVSGNDILFEPQPNYCTKYPLDFILIDNITNQESPRCSIKNLPITGIPPDNCNVVLTNTTGLKSSLMSLPYVVGNDQFCDDTQEYYHDPARKTKQNFLCKGKSTFTVIQEHPDFDGYSNPGNAKEVDPVFKIVKPASSSAFVLVLDVSGSMGGTKINLLKRGSEVWVKYGLQNNVPLGIVSFNKTAQTLFELTPVSDANRDTIDGIINGLSARGTTCIGLGLKKGLEVLKKGGIEHGGTLLLLSDGVENCNENIDSAIKDLTDQGVRVVTLLFGDSADTDAADLALELGGKFIIVGEFRTTHNDIYNALKSANAYQPSVPSDQINVVIYDQIFKDITTVSTEFTVDSTVGKSNIIKIDFDKLCPDNIKVNNIAYNNCDKSVFYKNVGDLTAGTYKIEIVLNQVDTVNIVVTSRAQAKTVPITTECWTRDSTSTTGVKVIIAKVKQGNQPVIRANVQALIYRDTEDVETLDLLDNGQMADNVADDGIYSRYFTTFPQNSNADLKYSFMCQVKETGGSSILGFKVARNLRSLPNLPTIASPICCGSTTQPDKAQLTNTGPLSRIAVGESTIIVNPGKVTFPPGTVTDLRVSHLNQTNKTIVLSFTATGERLDAGQLKQITIFYSNTSFTNIVDAVKLLPENLHNPTDLTSQVDPGTPIVLLLKWELVAGWREVFIRLVATNSKDLSTTSNLASAALPRSLAPGIVHDCCLEREVEGMRYILIDVDPVVKNPPTNCISACVYSADNGTSYCFETGVLETKCLAP